MYNNNDSRDEINYYYAYCGELDLETLAFYYNYGIRRKFMRSD